MATPRADVLLGGRYRLGEPLGTGGMAEVYDAFDERLQRRVAVKVLRSDMAARDDVRRRFEIEARSAASLSHPNVVAVFDTGEDADVPFLVMEKLPGETLADRMAAGSGSLDTAWVLRVGGDVLQALGAAHAAGLVHRDVKPGNVLIGSDGCAKVADFGIAKSLEVAAAADLTTTNQLIGTPAYVAPERILGEPASPQSDLYAVGVVLYEAFAGHKPFTGSTPVATAYAIRHETPQALGELRPDLAPAIVAAVETAMARDPARRFSTAADFASALGVDGPVVARADSDATVLALPVGAGASADGGASDTQVLAITDAVPVSALASTHADADVAAPQLPLLHDRRRLFVVAAIGLAVALLLFGLAASAGDREPTARERLSGELDAAAVSQGEGEPGTALRSLARLVAGGGGGPEATQLLARLAAWRDGGSLTPETADRLAELVARVPGADGTAFTPPTTAPPVTEPPRDREDDKDDEDEDKDKDNGKRGKSDD